jgi:outer membrane protein OmpA-like peptidoglycan-associated protein
LRRPSARLALLTLTLGLLAACDHRPEDFGRVRSDTAAFQASWQQRIDVLTARHAQMFQRAQGIPAGTPGLDQALNGLAGAKSQIDALQTQLTTATADVEARINARQRRLAGEVLERAGAELDASLQSTSQALDAVGPHLDAAISAAGKEQETATAGLAITDPAFARGRGATEVAGILFQPGTAAFDTTTPSTKAALDQILAFANSCPELRFALVAHTAKDGDAALNQRLSDAQAQAVQQYLIDNKVDAAKITQAQGVGGSQPMIAEPDAGSPEEAAMPVAELAEIRAKNRRITVLVLEPCKA